MKRQSDTRVQEQNGKVRMPTFSCVTTWWEAKSWLQNFPKSNCHDPISKIPWTCWKHPLKNPGLVFFRSLCTRGIIQFYPILPCGSILTYTVKTWWAMAAAITPWILSYFGKMRIRKWTLVNSSMGTSTGNALPHTGIGNLRIWVPKYILRTY
jgi:hypothetical protein